MSGIAENEMTIRDTDWRESRRLPAAGLAAIVLHAALIGFPLIQKMNPRQSDAGPIIVDFEAEAIQTQSAPSIAQTVPVQPEPSSTLSAAPASQADPGFTIPAPKSSPQAAAAPAGQTFRETGNRAGASSSTAPATAQAGPSPNLPANVSPQAQGSSSGAASAPPARGEGVLVSGQTNQNAGGSLDLGALDKALAGAKTGAQSTGQTGSKPQAAATGKIGDPKIIWDKPEAAKNRKPNFALNPKLPTWVAASGLTFKLTVSFTVSPEGVVSLAKINTSTGYADVDAAILEALWKWRFNADSESGAIRGVAPIVIQPQ